MKWEELSLKDRADLMKLYIQNGFTGLSKIRSHYNSLDEGGDLGGAKGEVPFTTNYSTLPDTSKKSISLDNLHELAKDNPALYKSYMQRLPKEYQAKVIENAARSRYGYEGLNQAMTAAATGGLPGLLGYTGSELINEGVRKFTDSNSWGDLIYKGNSPVIKTLAEISNPGNILGGIGSTRSITSRYKPNVGNSYSVTPEAIKSLLTP